jgi:Na+/H+-translocating membrane pyrophosphatase
MLATTGIHSARLTGGQLADAAATQKAAIGIVVFVMAAFALLQTSLPAAYTFTIGATLLASLGGIGWAAHLAQWVLAMPEGGTKAVEIATAIREGADGFLSTQYVAIAKMAVGALLLIIALFLSRDPPSSMGIGRLGLAGATAISFCTGAFLSGVAGYAGMWCSVRANSRVAAGAARGYNDAVQIALKSGAIAALLVVSLALMGICMLFAFFQFTYGGVGGVSIHRIPMLLVGYGFGASFVALFAQLGGGIYTKAADVGADMVGKVEQDIPEDDPRNPAVIADLVGDNVGDCAGRGADLFESIAAEIVSAMILGGTITETALSSHTGSTEGYVLFPLAGEPTDQDSTCGLG